MILSSLPTVEECMHYMQQQSADHGTCMHACIRAAYWLLAATVKLLLLLLLLPLLDFDLTLQNAFFSPN